MNFKFAEQITEGVKYLNSHDPEWPLRVNIGTLSMNSKICDVLAQTGIPGDDVSIELGFYTLEHKDILTDEWIQTIRSLRTKPSWDEAPPEATGLVQNASGTWHFHNHDNVTPVCNWMWYRDSGSSAGRFFPTTEPNPIPNPAWKASSYTRPEQNQGAQNMNFQESQRRWIKENNLRKGDKVKILRSFKYGEMGCDKACGPTMKRMVGETCVVVDECSDGDICINGFYWPWFVLEKVESAKNPFPMDKIAGYDITVGEDSLTIGCKTLSFCEIDKFIDDYHNWYKQFPAPIKGFSIDYLIIFGGWIAFAELDSFITSYKNWRKTNG